MSLRFAAVLDPGVCRSTQTAVASLTTKQWPAVINANAASKQNSAFQKQ